MDPYLARILSLIGDRPPASSLEQTPARLQAAVTRLGEAGLDKPFAPGKWTGRQVVAHLADTELGIGFRLRQALAEDNHAAQPFDQDRWAARLGERPNAALALAAFTGLRAWNLELIRALTPADLARPYVHGERGPETVGIIVRHLAGHDLNHLAQIESIAAS